MHFRGTPHDYLMVFLSCLRLLTAATGFELADWQRLHFRALPKETGRASQQVL